MIDRMAFPFFAPRTMRTRRNRQAFAVRATVLACMVALGGVTPLPAEAQRGIDNLPALGEAAVDELSPAAEQRLGDQIYQEFLRVGVVHDDPETTDYLSAQASRLLDAANRLGHSESARPFRFFVVNDATLNAFALPGGYIGVHTGLIINSGREAEVMSVLAHEIGHVTQRHIARMFGQQRQSSAVMIAAAVLAAMAAKGSPDAAMGVLSLGQTVAIRDQLSFSRDAEREADRVGLQILSQSGFEPQAMSSMFERLSQAGRLYDNNAPAYLRTHPLTTERIADIQSRLQNDPSLRAPAQGQAGGPESVQFAWIRAKLSALADTKVDGLRIARQRFDQQLADPKNATAGHRAPLHFGIAWAAIVQRDFAGALASMSLAEKEARSAGVYESVRPMLVHQRLRHAMAAGDSAQAKSAIDLIAREFSGHRTLMRTSIEAQLVFSMPPEDISAQARAVTQQWPQDPQAWALLARAELSRGKRSTHHAAVAEQYALSGAYPAAVEQLTLARSAGDADFVTLSKIDARLTTMRAALRREQLERQQQGR